MRALTAERMQTLATALVEAYAVRGGESEREKREIALVLGEVNAALKQPPAVRFFDPHGVTRYVDPAVAAARATAPALAAALEPVAAELHWRYSYVPRPDAPGLENEMAWTEIVGPGHYWHSDHVCLGLTLIAPGNLYPDHRHPAVELYTVVTGESDWTLEGVTTRRKPGDRILHESDVVHAMR
ncbi:MAG: cupin domain-containing protein, partial [Candidatus Accumulibacter sp.]|nr:cupin domain-containing protein [Accumulibacter sp.]